MKGHYFFKWLFLTVLSVSVLHFRENSYVGYYKTEQIFSGENIARKRIPGLEYCQKLSKARPTGFAYFKSLQYTGLIGLSNSLSTFVARYPEIRLHRAFAEFHIQNQHFRSRTLSPDDHSISRS